MAMTTSNSISVNAFFVRISSILSKFSSFVTVYIRFQGHFVENLHENMIFVPRLSANLNRSVLRVKIIGVNKRKQGSEITRSPV